MKRLAFFLLAMVPMESQTDYTFITQVEKYIFNCGELSGLITTERKLNFDHSQVELNEQRFTKTCHRYEGWRTR